MPISRDHPLRRLFRELVGVLPNYRTVQDTGDVEPIPAKRKLWIASKDSFDYPIWVLAAGFAGMYQVVNENPSFGQGAKGYFKRYGASFADQFGRRINKCYRGRLQTTIEDLHLGSPVIRSHYKSSSVKQYVRDHKTLRTEPSSNNVRDLGEKKAVEHLPELRKRFQQVVDNYLNVQQDILETFLNRGEIERLSQPTA